MPHLVTLARTLGSVSALVLVTVSSTTSLASSSSSRSCRW